MARRKHVELVGEKDLYRTLESLTGEINRRLLNSSFKAATKPAIKRMQSAYQGIEPRLVDSVKAKQAKKKTGVAGVFVGPWRTVAGRRRKSEYFFTPKTQDRRGKAYAHMAAIWHEWGTYSGERIPASRIVAKTKPGAIDEVERDFTKILRKKVDSWVRRKAKKLGLI